MIRFSQTFGAHSGRVVEFDQDLVSFGRMPTCDVAFDPEADLDASGQHAVVRRMADGWHVIDSESRNGTWLNGQKVQRAVLSSGDELEFGMGGPRLKVELVEAGAPAAPSALTGPMTPAGQAYTSPYAGAAPTPASALGESVDGRAATVAVMATPVPMVAGAAPGFDHDPPTRLEGRRGTDPQTPIAGGVGPAAHRPAFAGPSQVPQTGLASPSSSPVVTPGAAPKRYGERTVGLMIDAALAQQSSASGSSPSRSGHSTEEIRAIAAAAAPPSSTGLKLVVALLMLLLGLVLAGAGAAIWYLLPKSDAPTGSDGPSPAASIEAARQLITTQSAAAMYVLVEERDGVDRGVCVAFAVRPDLLATSAACVLEIEAGREGQATHFAVPNGGGGRRLPIVRMGYHPSYVQGAAPSADVGIVHLATPTTVQSPLAAMADLGALAAGDPIFVYGFPAGLDNVVVPVADLSAGTLTAMTAFDGSTGAFPTSQVLRHGVPPGPGTRGSPIFDASGRVVGVSAGAYGVRVDLLASLLAGMQR